ncbi:MAG TPA: hypothetical protein VGD78_11670 [Chthoniobacterales bacterium]
MKKLFNNRRSGGWNLIEIIVAVAIGASIAAAGVVAYQGEAKKASVAKAKQFISQVETKKASILSDVVSGAIAAAPSPLDTAILTGMKVNGKPLTGVSGAGADATTLGFAWITVGALDTLNADGSVNVPGAVASVTLNGGTVVSGGTVSGGTY